MASSNNSKTEKKKIRNGETSKISSKARKEKNKKVKLSNGNLKDHDKVLIVPSSSTESPQEEDEEEGYTVMTNGRSSAPKLNKSKRKRQDLEVEGTEEDDEVEGKEDVKVHTFPMNRIRTIIKGEDPDLKVSQEAIFSINKAAEKFLKQFTQDAYACSVKERKKSLSYNHLAYVVSKQRRYDFLSDFVPEKVKAEDALRERNSEVNGAG